MNIIKLSAIGSTNDYLKELNIKNLTANFTVVHTENQTSAKSQRGNNWFMEPNKNLTFSILIKDLINERFSIFDLSILICVSTFSALKKINIPGLKIKWPNDILAEDKKICGILIENSFNSNQGISSVVGIGINLNQTNFENLPKATSLKNLTSQHFNIDEILHLVVKEIQINYEIAKKSNSDIFWEIYHENLFRKNILSVFEYPNGQKFMGIIQKVIKNGKIQIKIENNTIKEFDLKEISIIY